MYIYFLPLSKYFNIDFIKNVDLSWKVSLTSLTDVYINKFYGYLKKYST